MSYHKPFDYPIVLDCCQQAVAEFAGDIREILETYQIANPQNKAYGIAISIIIDRLTCEVK